MTAVSIEDVIERIRAAAGAEFAFVLTMRGRLVTDRAPREMPEAGRARLVGAARSIMDGRNVERLTLPRDALVPYGGSAPIDVFFAVAAERAIVCAVVISRFPESRRVRSAIEAGLDEIEAKFQSAFDSRVLSRGAAELPPSTRKEPATTGSIPPPGADPPHSGARAQSSSSRGNSASRRRRDQGTSPLQASPRALDRSSLGQPHSVPVPPVSVARFVATGEPSHHPARDRSWADRRVLQEIESDAREASEPISAPLPPTARRESLPPLDASSPALSQSRKSAPPNVTVELADADDDLLEAVRLNEAQTAGHSEEGQTDPAPKRKEGGDSLPATQRVPEPRR
jgi:hypothetical protein